MEVPVAQGGFASVPEPVSGTKIGHRSETFVDHCSQATLFFQSQTPVEQQHMFSALQFELGKVSVPAVQLRMLPNLVNVDPDLTKRVSMVLGVAVPPASSRIGTKRYEPSAMLSMVTRGNPKTVVGRKIGVLAVDGVHAAG